MTNRGSGFSATDPAQTERKRMRWRANVVARPADLAIPYRHPAPDDCELLGSLMLAAYRGTIDERYQTSADASSHVAKYFGGQFGEPLLDCSYVAVHDTRPISAALVSMDGDEPLLAQAYTAPDWQNRGLASALIQMSMSALAANDLRALNLVATVGNLPAEHVYRKLGFEPFDQEQ